MTLTIAEVTGIIMALIALIALVINIVAIVTKKNQNCAANTVLDGLNTVQLTKWPGQDLVGFDGTTHGSFPDAHNIRETVLIIS